jgi:hypothetical protein
MVCSLGLLFSSAVYYLLCLVVVSMIQCLRFMWWLQDRRRSPFNSFKKYRQLQPWACLESASWQQPDKCKNKALTRWSCKHRCRHDMQNKAIKSHAG